MISKSLLIKIVRGTILGILLSGVILGCATEAIKLDYNHKKSTPELERYRGYVHELSDGKLGNKDFSIGFIEMPDKQYNLLGRCTLVLKDFNKEIDIVAIHWLFMDQKRRILLTAHEYKHCECNQYYHKNTKLKDGCPSSYFNEYLPDEDCVEAHWDMYLEEISKGCE